MSGLDFFPASFCLSLFCFLRNPVAWPRGDFSFAFFVCYLLLSSLSDSYQLVRCQSVGQTSNHSIGNWKQESPDYLKTNWAPTVLQCTWHLCRLPECHSRIEKKATKCFYNTLSQWRQRSNNFPIVFNEHQKGPFKTAQDRNHMARWMIWFWNNSPFVPAASFK